MIRGIQLKDKDQWGKLFIDLKNEIYQLWENNLELSNFTKLPKDLIYNEVQPNYILPAKKLENWQSHSLETMRVHDIIKQLSPYVNWKQTYKIVYNPRKIFQVADLSGKSTATSISFNFLDEGQIILACYNMDKATNQIDSFIKDINQFDSFRIDIRSRELSYYLEAV